MCRPPGRGRAVKPSRPRASSVRIWAPSQGGTRGIDPLARRSRRRAAPVSRSLALHASRCRRACVRASVGLHLESMTRRVWFFVVPLVALLVFAARSRLVHRSSSPPAVGAPTSTSAVVERTAAVTTNRPAASGAGPVLAPDDEDVDSRAARVITSPVFSGLPPSDQRWVLVQARARLQGPDDPRLDQVVHELSEVRLFAVSEREEPLAPLAASR
jgi:hypothetical protein